MAIASAKRGVRRTRLRNAWPAVERRYTEYAGLVPGLESLSPSPFSGVLKRDCRHCYTKETKPLSTLITQVLKVLPTSRSTLCQYCLFGEVDSIDHYAPKGLFPEFSIFPRNLIPSCPKCNRLKGESWVTGGSRDIMSLYYDDLPKRPYLHVSVDMQAGSWAAVKYSLRRGTAIGRALFNRLERHFEVLQLIDRYNSHAAEHVSEVTVQAKALSGRQRNVVVKFFRDHAGGLVGLHGVNHWKAVLLNELAESDAFFASVGIS